MTEPLISAETRALSEIAEQFRAMAARVELNGVDTFGGAVVIVPPQNGGESIEVLILDPQQNPVLFWSSVKSKVDLALQAVETTLEAQRRASWR